MSHAIDRVLPMEKYKEQEEEYILVKCSRTCSIYSSIFINLDNSEEILSCIAGFYGDILVVYSIFNHK
jgi:hypothetical protein